MSAKDFTRGMIHRFGPIICPHCKIRHTIDNIRIVYTRLVKIPFYNKESNSIDGIYKFRCICGSEFEVVRSYTIPKGERKTWSRRQRTALNESGLPRRP